jgi:hypothetical protein
VGVSVRDGEPESTTCVEVSKPIHLDDRPGVHRRGVTSQISNRHPHLSPDLSVVGAANDRISRIEKGVAAHPANNICPSVLLAMASSRAAAETAFADTGSPQLW